MKSNQRAAVLTLLIREMGQRGSWCGETHIQKAVFLLQELVGVDLSLDFVLYRHGPFSFDLRDELSSMEADELLSVVVRQPGYGPAYVPTDFSFTFLERFPNTVSRYHDRVTFVAEEIGDKGVADLERLSTAFYVASREGIMDPDERANRVVDLKPHVTLPDARAASAEVYRLIKRAHWFRRDESVAAS